MFSGIIQEVGKVKSIKNSKESLILEIEADKAIQKSQRGDSISVNGVCLTITQRFQRSFIANVMIETYEKTNLKYLQLGSLVNLEEALSFSSLLGGHLVYGHVDNVGQIENIEKTERHWKLTITTEVEVLKHIIAKASVAINGVSLTVGEVDNSNFSLYLIPTTIEDTNMKSLMLGELVNIEVDMLAKYVYHYVNKTEQPNQAKKISEEYLREHGF